MAGSAARVLTMLELLQSGRRMRPHSHHRRPLGGLDTAEAILQLRALHANGDFDEYWAYHLQREHQRNHPHHYDLAA